MDSIIFRQILFEDSKQWIEWQERRDCCHWLRKLGLNETADIIWLHP